MLLLLFQFSDFLSEPLVLFIGGLQELIFLFEALFQFRRESGVLLSRVGGGHFIPFIAPKPRLNGTPIPMSRLLCRSSTTH